MEQSPKLEEVKFFRVESTSGNKLYYVARDWECMKRLISSLGRYPFVDEKSLVEVREEDVKYAPYYPHFVKSERRLASDKIFSLGVVSLHEEEYRSRREQY